VQLAHLVELGDRPLRVALDGLGQQRHGLVSATASSQDEALRDADLQQDADGLDARCGAVDELLGAVDVAVLRQDLGQLGVGGAPGVGGRAGGPAGGDDVLELQLGFLVVAAGPGQANKLIMCVRQI